MERHETGMCGPRRSRAKLMPTDGEFQTGRRWGHKERRSSEVNKQKRKTQSLEKRLETGGSEAAGSREKGRHTPKIMRRGGGVGDNRLSSRHRNKEDVAAPLDVRERLNGVFNKARQFEISRNLDWRGWRGFYPGMG